MKIATTRVYGSSGKGAGNGHFSKITYLKKIALNFVVLWMVAGCNDAPAQAPEQVGATTVDSQVIVYWDEVDDAQSYNVYWNTTGKDSATDEHTSTEHSPVAISGLRTGSTYYFRVISVSSAGESARSEQIELRPTSSTLQSIAVSPDKQTIVVGTRRYFTATGVYSDGSTRDISRLAKWESSDSLVATVLNEDRGAGLVTAINFGSASISATFRGIKGSATVLPIYDELRDLTILPHDPQIAVDTKIAFTAIGHFHYMDQDLTESVTWVSSNREVAQSSSSLNRRGMVEAGEIGKSTISASFGGTVAQSQLSVSSASLQSIRLTPTEPNIALGLKQAFTAIGLYSDGTSKDITPNVIWESSDPTVATVTNYSSASDNITPAGVAQSFAGRQGDTVINARLQKVSAETTLTVSAPRAISMKLVPETMSLKAGTSAQVINADIYYSDGSSVRYDISSFFHFAVSDSNVAIIDSNGTVTGLTPGDTTIVATFSASPSLSASVAVKVYAADALPPDHNLAVTGCIACHDGNTALGKPTAHPITSELCEACHANTSWLPLMLPFAHDQVMDTCNVCHNNLIARGISATHPGTSDVCENCHTTVDWFQIVLNHSAFAGLACATSGCHDGKSFATYKSATHPPTTDVCEACHGTVSWLPVLIPFDHSQVITPVCSDCHSTSLPVNHCPTKDDCSSCHDVLGWLPATANCPLL